MEHVQRSLHQAYGPLLRIAPNEIACADPEAIRTICPAQQPLVKTDFYPVWANTTFPRHPDSFSETSEKSHSQRRRILNHVYSLSNVLQSKQYIDNCSPLFATRLHEFADRSKVLDLGEWLQWCARICKSRALSLLICFGRYALAAIGELFFGQMFGFMRQSEDHESYIKSLDTLLPVLCTVAVAPSYTSPLILMSSILNPMVRKALKAVDHIAAAAQRCVNQRTKENSEESVGLRRRDPMQQLLDIAQGKEEKVDFDVGEVQYEACVAL